MGFRERCVREWSSTDGWREHADPLRYRARAGEWAAENMYIDEMAAFLRAIREGPDAYPFSLQDDDHLLRALVAIERSSVDRTPV